MCTSGFVCFTVERWRFSVPDRNSVQGMTQGGNCKQREGAQKLGVVFTNNSETTEAQLREVAGTEERAVENSIDTRPHRPFVLKKLLMFNRVAPANDIIQRIITSGSYQ